jgi:arginine:agmatine antiporter
MMGSGVYLLPASLAVVGSSSVIAWVIAIGAALLFAAVFASLTGRGQGGSFVHRIEDAFGARAGFMAAAFYWMQGVLGNVALALAVTGYAGAIFPTLREPSAMLTTTLSVLALFTLLSLYGPRLIARLEGWTLALGLIPVLGAATIGWFWFDPRVFADSWNMTDAPVSAHLPSTVVMILWAFLGLESASLAASMVRDPAKTVPRATMLGVLGAALIYLSACTMITGIIPAETLQNSTAPFADMTVSLFGAGMGVAVAICAALRTSGALGGWMLVTAESGRLALDVRKPGRPDSVQPSRTNILVNSSLLFAIALLMSSASLAEQFTAVINAAVILMLCTYALAAAALLSFERAGDRHIGIIILAILGICIAVAIIATQPMDDLMPIAGMILLTALGWEASRRLPKKAAEG